ncbi:FadR/GntR family transcriptional regulator [Isoptericola sp. NPDC057391]|uniref:FadR/GntR family transcriptional regulator n=1 Tax=Isoptericola sp. NPDC057391 TaxID=3346117 RepID=UPI0036395232
MPTDLSRDSLAAQVHEAIVEHIDGAGLRPGDSLPSTAALSDLFKVSRPVVREALSSLQAIGLIELSNGRNAVVRELDGHLIKIFLSRAIRGTPRPLRTLMEMRAPLEVQAATLAAQRVSEEDGRALVASVQAMADKVDDARLYVQLDLDLHRRIAELSGNEALLWVSEAVSNRVFEAMMQLRAHREELGTVGQERELHARIAGAIADGDAAAAARAMQEHMDVTQRLVEAVEG